MQTQVPPVPSPAATADDLKDHKVPTMSLEPTSQPHTIPRASAGQLELALEMNDSYSRF